MSSINKYNFLFLFILMVCTTSAVHAQTIPTIPSIPVGDSLIIVYDAVIDTGIISASNQVTINVTSPSSATFVSDDPKTTATDDATATTIGRAMYYPATSATDLSQPTSWTTQFTGGAGGITPLNFGASLQDFIINGNITTPAVSNPWVISGGSTVSLSNRNGILFNPASRLSIGSGSTVDFGNTRVFFKSDATGTASIGTVSGSLQNAGNVVVEKYNPGGVNNSSTQTYKRAYRYLAHPFTGNIQLSQLTDNFDITGTGGSANGFTTTVTNQSSAYWYNPANAVTPEDPERKGWVAYTNTNGSAPNLWQKSQGMIAFIRGAKGEGLNGVADYTQSAVTIDMTGTPNVGDQTIAVSSAGPSTYSLIGNPFASSVDMKKVSRTNVSNSIYVWDLAFAGGKGAYRAIDLSDPAVTSYILPAYSSFFISSTGAGSQLVFEETDKSASASTNQLFKMATTNTLELELRTSNILWDVFSIKNNVNAVSGQDVFDASKIYNPDANLFSINSDNKSLAIDQRNLQPSDIIKLALYTNEKRTYSFKVSEAGLTSTMPAYLKDKYFTPAKITALTDGAVYNFEVTNDTASFGENRFQIVFIPGTVLPLTTTNVRAYTKNSGVEVEWKTSNESNLVKHEIERAGIDQQFHNIGSVAARNQSINDYSFTDPNPFDGTNLYRIKTYDRSGEIKFSNVVRITTGKQAPSISIYPKPINNGVINMQMINLAKGTYTVQLFNMAGQQMFAGTIEHAGGSATNQLKVPSTSAGTYNLVLSNGDTKFTEVILMR